MARNIDERIIISESDNYLSRLEVSIAPTGFAIASESVLKDANGNSQVGGLVLMDGAIHCDLSCFLPAGAVLAHRGTISRSPTLWFEQLKPVEFFWCVAPGHIDELITALSKSLPADELGYIERRTAIAHKPTGILLHDQQCGSDCCRRATVLLPPAKVRASALRYHQSITDKQTIWQQLGTAGIEVVDA
jgi:hypothetical protein